MSNINSDKIITWIFVEAQAKEDMIKQFVPLMDISELIND